MLEVVDVTAHHGRLRAISEINIRLEPAETLAIVGANGAGKSTLLAVLSGLLTPTSGRVVFNGEDVTREPAHRRAARGIALVVEGRHLFPSLTVEENLKVSWSSGRAGQWSLERIYELFPMVADRRNQRAVTLSGGQQQAVAIARALMTNPELLLIDEASLGLAPIVVAQLYDALVAVRETGTTVLIVEQDLSLALRMADRLICLLEGQVRLDAPVAAVSREEVTAAYFGTRAATGTGH
jgi:branched-chain amino acid transport system ATP-binding protein